MKLKTKAFMPARDKAIVIGTSAGGMNASIKLLKQFSSEFAAPILLIQHISGDVWGDALLNALNNSSQLTCMLAVHDHALQKGYVYLAPPDHHLMVTESGHVQVTKGARENRFRPAIESG